jgi:protein-tyrosine phosphatase
VQYGRVAWSVLFVCTANICRSAMAERLARGGLEVRLGDAAADIAVTSAGTRGWEGAPMDPSARAVLRQRGADPSGFVARQLTADMVRGASLILCAERTHRAEAVTLVPAATRRTFTIREFDRLLRGVDTSGLGAERVAERADAMVNLAARRRGVQPAGDPADDDVPDAYRRPYEVFAECAQMIADSLRGPINILADLPARRA